jgi:glycine oxidase
VACLSGMRGKSVVVIDNGHRTAASLAAAGIMNPITGQRLNRPYLVDQLLQSAFETYPRIEKFLGIPLFQRRTVLRILRSQSESRRWEQRLVSGQYQKYLGSTNAGGADFLEQKYGGFEIARAGLLDVPTFVQATRRRLSSSGKLIESDFRHSDLKVSRNGVRWENCSAKIVIFCEGYQLTRNPFFSPVKLNPAKGEVLTLDAAHFTDKRIIQHAKWLLRTINGEVKAGTTYTWTGLNENPTMPARTEIERALRDFVRFDFEVKHQIAGVRPVTKADNRPVVGVHPFHRSLAILNGLGSKGVLQTPFAAAQLLAYLEEGEPIHPAFDLCRKSLWK